MTLLDLGLFRGLLHHDDHGRLPFSLDRQALQPAALVDDPLEHASHRHRVERPGVLARHPLEDRRLALGRVDGQADARCLMRPISTAQAERLLSRPISCESIRSMRLRQCVDRLGAAVGRPAQRSHRALQPSHLLRPDRPAGSLLQEAHQRAAHHHAVGHRRGRRRLLRRRDAEPQRDRLVRQRAQALDERSRVVGQRSPARR